MAIFEINTNRYGFVSYEPAKPKIAKRAHWRSTAVCTASPKLELSAAGKDVHDVSWELRPASVEHQRKMRTAAAFEDALASFRWVVPFAEGSMKTLGIGSLKRGVALVLGIGLVVCGALDSKRIWHRVPAIPSS